MAVVGATIVLAALALAVPVAAAEAAELFGSREVRSDDLSAFGKWSDMLKRHAAHDGIGGAADDTASPLERSGTCLPNPRVPCPEESLAKFVAGLRGHGTAERLEAVNRYVNRMAYITDDVNWGMVDYWATPEEFFQRSGDCEDFAIAKYLILKELGQAPSTMRIVILEDLNLGIHHAVLIVETGNSRMVLDNQISQVVPDIAIHHYRPVYSINEDAWWLHINEESDPKLAQR